MARQHLAYYPYRQQTIAKTIIAIQIKFSGCLITTRQPEIHSSIKTHAQPPF
ncbi:hypothetical protein [Kingella oralis]|uniref:hypothetical protein n=1 Tax=Kingella oralis TaxID=505 RepID=UPI0028E54146|nr:hypothetical protein [Kingella oralis]